MLSIKELDYVAASKAIGASRTRILLVRIVPNAITPIVVLATLGIASAILDAAGLSFLGMGVQPPTASWGAMLSVGRNYVGSAWWIATFPGVCLFLLVLSVNLIGDRLAETLNPKSR